MLGLMFAGGGWMDAVSLVKQQANNYELFLIAVGAVLSWPVRRHLEAALFLWRRRYWPSVAESSGRVSGVLAISRTVVYSATTLLALSAMAANSHQAFIYFRF
jgi:hypothetical protein